MDLKELFSKTIFFFGAGATAGCGCLTSNLMLEDLENSINERQSDERSKTFLEIYRFILATLHYQNSLKNSSQDSKFISAPNIEEFVFILKKIIHRDSIIPAPLVGNWRDFIIKYEYNNNNIFTDFLGFIEEKLYSKWLSNVDKEKAKELLTPIEELLTSSDSFQLNLFTINYDLVLEHYFNLDGVTNIRTGFSGEQWADDFDSNDGNVKSKINYFKLHGSLDWEMEEGYLRASTSHIASKNPWVIFGEESKMVSVEPFLSLLVHYKQKLKEADYIICVGYSFFDTYINNLLLQAVNLPGKRLIVVDKKPESPREFVDRLRNIQQNDYSHKNNTTTISEERLKLFSNTTAADFFKSVLGRDASGLLNIIDELQRESITKESPF